MPSEEEGNIFLKSTCYFRQQSQNQGAQYRAYKSPHSADGHIDKNIYGVKKSERIRGYRRNIVTVKCPGYSGEKTSCAKGKHSESCSVYPYALGEGISLFNSPEGKTYAGFLDCIKYN